jgi:hypothetical protein
MKCLIGVMAVVLLVGRSRRAFFRRWRFTVTAVTAGAAALFIVPRMMGPGDPPWVPAAVAAFVALGAGAACREWLDDVLGKEK